MPQCEPRCPVFRAELRRIINQAPWLREEALLTSDKAKFASKTPVSDVYTKSVAGKHLSTFDLESKDSRREKESVRGTPAVLARETEQTVHREIASDSPNGIVPSQIDRSLPTENGSKAEYDEAGATETRENRTAVPSGTASEKTRWQAASDVEIVGSSLEKTGPARAWNRASRDVASGRDIHRGETKTRPKMPNAVDSREARTGKTSRDLVGEEFQDDKTGPIEAQEECEHSCPRRISRNRRIRQLEERQRSVDVYFLSKGSNYFDDICTCSLACILRALRDDPFVRSILTSTALFTFGLKLCSELNAWYLPARIS